MIQSFTFNSRVEVFHFHKTCRGVNVTKILIKQIRLSTKKVPPLLLHEHPQRLLDWRAKLAPTQLSPDALS